jgi:CRISPR/Cas system endoribonuclease Cas6 (RAMP superfamily)
MSFTTLTFRLLLSKNLSFNYFSGYYIRGYFYSTLRKFNSELAENIHNSRTLAPFSSKTLTLEQQNYRHVVFNYVNNPSPASFGYSIFLKEISKEFLEYAVQEGSVTLLNEKFPLNEIAVKEVNWEEIVENSKPIKKFDLVFLTPTYFRLPPTLFERYEAKLKLTDKKEKAPYRYYPLPDPSLLLRSVSKLWKKFSPVELNLKGLLSWVSAGGVAISGFPYGIKTYKLYEHEKANKWVVGFMGKVGYSLPEDLFNKNFAKDLDALLKFSQFSNVGGGRTAGLGMVNYIPLEYSE